MSQRSVACLGEVAAEEIAFDGFRLVPTRRLLLNGDEPVRLGNRALDLLIALSRRPGQLISKQELTATVWPDTFVEDGNLKVHISALRRALGDGKTGRRYISTVAGRGYCFVAPVKVRADAASERAGDVEPHLRRRRRHNLPALLTPLIGRDDGLGKIEAQLRYRRLLTLVGPGGVGKTSMALAAATNLTEAYADGVWFVDLSAVCDPLLVPEAAASAVGLDIGDDEVNSSLLSFLADKQMLLVLDNCEHVVDAAAALAFRLLRAAPDIHILATSREALRVSGEYVYRLPALEQPLFSTGLDASQALAFPAVRLFAERAAGVAGEFELHDCDVPAVVDICRKLDGLPLAIELAAAEIATFGIAGVAARLRNDLRPTIRQGHAANTRHCSLRASLDWSYALLTGGEQRALRRLAVFGGSFTLRAARPLAGDRAFGDGEMIDDVASLAAKSLLTVDLEGSEPRFRMPNTTRAYALDKLLASRDAEALTCRQERYARAVPQAA
jgi:predicted ATPase/DNA-binding winged helix-turn-helix (wHTH) protein